ncbi:hypothetical protein [Oscillatoria sp. FACHB-1406]|uniref:hypothetical protein n=1 Tax=Oscillatoria sp. FACHB-1406 TaxID=2692846 RepID=UPI001681C497|nr:hypothetical protein [Oscillatoria sp. FACHB-1406]MBD2577067.1 hypothetical protein [Oscillatoria sp. FACHB-1406]
MLLAILIAYLKKIILAPLDATMQPSSKFVKTRTLPSLEERHFYFPVVSASLKIAIAFCVSIAIQSSNGEPRSINDLEKSILRPLSLTRKQ